MTGRPKIRSWEELEALTGIKRNVSRSFTQRDVENLTRERLKRWPAWRRRLGR